MRENDRKVNLAGSKMMFALAVKRLLLSLAWAGLSLAPPHRADAQVFTNLFSFAAKGSSVINSNGIDPLGGLCIFGQTLFGTTSGGGSSGFGVVFRLNTDGTDFTNLHSFIGEPTEGDSPAASLTLSENTLYGTTTASGAGGSGTVFAVNTDGSGFTNLHSFGATHYPYFTNADGLGPRAPLVLLNGVLYGTAPQGGIWGNGVVFALGIDGTGFSDLHIFTATSGSGTNNDGAGPSGGLLLSGTVLYGTTPSGGRNGAGTLFSINVDGSGFTSLYNFSGGADGAYPTAGLIQSGTILYGTASAGGTAGNGTVFAVNTNGAGFVVLHSFATNTEGSNPNAPLIQTGNTLYGTTQFGGAADAGTLFVVNSDGTDFATLFSFQGASPPIYTNSGGAYPNGGVILFGNALYGTASESGDFGRGTVFSLALGPPVLSISTSAKNILLTWSTNAEGLTLQVATNLTAPITWTSSLREPVVLNGQNAVTDSFSAIQRFYRLSR